MPLINFKFDIDVFKCKEKKSIIFQMSKCNWFSSIWVDTFLFRFDLIYNTNL